MDTAIKFITDNWLLVLMSIWSSGACFMVFAGSRWNKAKRK